MDIGAKDFFYYKLRIYENNEEIGYIKASCSRYNECKSQTITVNFDPENPTENIVFYRGDLEDGIYALNVYDYSANEWIANSFVVGKPEEKQEHNNWCLGADINRDEAVDWNDFLILWQNYRRKDCSMSNSWCDGSDIDRNGRVVGGDFGIFAGQYMQKNCVGLTCDDSDCGKMHYIKGTSCEGESCYADSCDSGKLTEYYCNKGILTSIVIDCSDGCEGNACVSDDNAGCSGTDINRDGKVDDIDSEILQSHYRRTDCSESNFWCDGADINKDGKV